MKGLKINARTLALLVVLVPLIALFGYAALRSGPLAPVQLTLTQGRTGAHRARPVWHRYRRGPRHLPHRADLRRAGQPGGGGRR